MKKPNRLPPFVAISWKILNSTSYKEINFASAKLLPYLLGKPKLRFDDPNYYESIFNFSYGEAKKLGFSRETFARCVRDLIAWGFLVKVSSGGIRGNSKSYSKYKLDTGWIDRERAELIKVAIYRIQSVNRYGQRLKTCSTSSDIGTIEGGIVPKTEPIA